MTANGGPPRVLVLETSGRTGEVAIAHGDKVLGTRRLEETRRHARDLAPAVAELLREQGWRPRGIGLLIVSRGPGSYTGLRVGIMAAKIFAYATGCRLIAVDTFEAIASQAPAEASEIDVLADAQQGKVYVQRFVRTSPPSVRASDALSIQPFAHWLESRSANAWVTGPALRIHTLPPEVSAVSSELWDPRVSALLRIGLERFDAGRDDDVWTVEPLYLRASAAEEQWRSRRN